MAKNSDRITPGSGNVFADIGMPDPEAHEFKAPRPPLRQRSAKFMRRRRDGKRGSECRGLIASTALSSSASSGPALRKLLG